MTIEVETLAAIPSLDGFYEVIGDQNVEKPQVGAFEYDLASWLGRILGNGAEQHGLGVALVEMLFDFRPTLDRQRRPDVEGDPVLPGFRMSVDALFGLVEC